jgi:hypothetical protein
MSSIECDFCFDEARHLYRIDFEWNGVEGRQIVQMCTGCLSVVDALEKKDERNFNRLMQSTVAVKAKK